MTAKCMLVAAGLFGLTATALGALGAHALKAKLAADAMAAYHTAVNYQFFHALALLATGLLALRASSGALSAAGWLFTVGVIAFSGSIYLLSTRHLLGCDALRFLGPVTPLGGFCLMAGWGALIVAALRLAK